MDLYQKRVTFLLAIISDLLSVNRKLLEEVQRHQRARLLDGVEEPFPGVHSIDGASFARRTGAVVEPD